VRRASSQAVCQCNANAIMGNSKYPGPVCKVLKDLLEIDPGTNCRSTSPTPGPVTGGHGVAGMAVADAKARYLSHARYVSYAMQGKSLLPGDHSSWLGGAFLRMYLDHKLDDDTVKKAGEEIGASKTFEQLQKDTNDHLQLAVDRHGHMLNRKEIADEARRYLKARKDRGGIAFRGALNPVIGGVGGVDVDAEATTSSESQLVASVVLDYEIDVIFSDIYDFKNRRTGEYDRYRKHLADLLRRNEFRKFEEAYRTEVQPVGSWHKTHLDNAALFASFMYALENRGWTPGGLPWRVTIRMRGKLHNKTAIKPAHARPSAHGTK